MIELPDPQSAEVVSDWIELQLSLSQERVQRGMISAAIRGAIGDEPTDTFLAEVWLEMESRQRLYNPPLFVVDDFAIEPIAIGNTKRLVYEICLILSLYGNNDRTGTAGKLFERITNEALKEFFSADSLVFGYRGGNIADTTFNLATEINERFIVAPDGRFKDRGLDIVTWKPFPDERTGKMVLLTQCASGHNWKDKFSIPMRAWEQYIHWAIAPTMAFSVPCIVSAREWHDHSVDKGMLIDRVRLIGGMPDIFSDLELEEDLSNWIEIWKQEQDLDD